MAVTTNTKSFIPELWSDQLIKQLQTELINRWPGFNRPKRDKATQALRDAALGHPEYEQEDRMFKELEKIYVEMQKSKICDQKTATEVRIQHEKYEHMLDSYRYMLDSDILDARARDRGLPWKSTV